jgi:type II secretory pathway pseudopilin PulG
MSIKKTTTKRTIFNVSFTIVELAIIVGVVSLVAGISVTNIKQAVAERRDERRAADVNIVRKALNLYYTQYGIYPVGSARSDSLCWVRNENRSSCHPLGILRELGLVARVPIDPGANARVSGDVCDGGQFYSYKSDGVTYTFGAVKELSSDSCHCSFEWGSYKQCATQVDDQ